MNRKSCVLLLGMLLLYSNPITTLSSEKAINQQNFLVDKLSNINLINTESSILESSSTLDVEKSLSSESGSNDSVSSSTYSSESNTIESEEATQRSNGDITITSHADSLIVTIKNEPDSRSVIRAVSEKISEDSNIMKVTFDGKFGADNAGGWGFSLATGNVNSIHFRNSNYIPTQLYASNNGLNEISDDGSIRRVSTRGIKTVGGNVSDIKSIELNGVESIAQWNLEGFSGNRLKLPSLRSLGSNRGSSVIRDMQNIEEIKFSQLQSITGSGLFTNMPNIREIDLSSLKEIDTASSFFNFGNRYPVYVKLDTIDTFPDNIGSNPNIASAPIYINVGEHFTSNLESSSTNILAYSSINKTNETLYSNTKDTITLKAFGENFYTYTSNIDIVWYINGELSNYTGAELNLDASDLGEGNFSFKPMIFYNGNEEPSFFQGVEFNVVINDSKPTATAVPQTIPLGGKFLDDELQRLASEVKYNDVELEPDDYVVSISSQPNTSYVHSQEIQATVTHIATGAFINIMVPVRVVWGDSINISGSWLGSSGFRSVGAFTLHPNRGITFSPANTANMNQASFSRHVGNRAFSRFSIFEGADELLLEGPSTVSYFSFEMLGTQSPNQILSSFLAANYGSNLINVNFGDVVRSWTFYRNNAVHNDPVINNRLWNVLRENGGQADYSNGLHNIYYEVTESGYRPLQINQATVKAGRTTTAETDEQLSQRIQDFIDIPEGIDSFEFVSYPDRSSIGTSTGIIRATQISTIGKKFQFDYEVVFNVESGSLELSEIVNADFDFGGVKAPSRNQVVSAIGSSPPEITINDYSNKINWMMYVSSTPFKNKSNQKLNGATIVLRDLKVMNSNQEGIDISKKDIYLDRIPSILARKSSSNNGDYGKTTIQIGETKNNLLTGVSLIIPENASFNKGEYQTQILWELVGDPTIASK